MAETPESLYEKRFKEVKLGSDVVSLAKKVLSSGIRLTQKGSPLMGNVVTDIGNGKDIMLEEDLRVFIDKVAKLGGYQENSSYRAIKDFLSETPVRVRSKEEITSTENS